MLTLLIAMLNITYSWSDPVAATHTVAALRGHPELTEPMLRICGRESRWSHCGPLVGVHRGDAKYSDSVWRNAVRAGHVDPDCQPNEPGQWSTHGTWGLMAGYQLHRLGIPCLPPRVLDWPLVSAWIASGKLLEHCATEPLERIASTSRWEGSDCQWWKDACRVELDELELDEEPRPGCLWVHQMDEDKHLDDLIEQAIAEGKEESDG